MTADPGAVTPLDRLLAESEIRAVLLRYVRGIDRLDLDLVRACYHPGATDEHGSWSGTVDEFCVWVDRILRRYDSTFHLLGNPLVELTASDRARVETYGMSFHRTRGGEPHLNLVTGFRYVDRFERRADEWRIARRVAVTEWSRRDDEPGWWDFPTTMRTGRRDRTDAVYDD